jgi:hypothetical protein
MTGMSYQASEGWSPCKGLLTRLLEGNSKFHEAGEPAGTMKVSQWGKRVIWTLKERDVLLDSSDMDHLDWKWIAEEIEVKKNYFFHIFRFLLLSEIDLYFERLTLCSPS